MSEPTPPPGDEAIAYLEGMLLYEDAAWAQRVARDIAGAWPADLSAQIAHEAKEHLLRTSALRLSILALRVHRAIATVSG